MKVKLGELCDQSEATERKQQTKRVWEEVSKFDCGNDCGNAGFSNRDYCPALTKVCTG